MVQPPLSSRNIVDERSTQMKPSAGCEAAGLPGWRPLSLAHDGGTYHSGQTEAWLLEVFSAERKKGNNAETNSLVEAAETLEDSTYRLPSSLHPREGRGRGAGAGTAEGSSRQDSAGARSLTTPAPGFSTPKPVSVETWKGLQPVQLNYIDVEQAKRALPPSLSPHPTPPSYLATYRGNLAEALPLQGAFECSTEDNDDQLTNAFALERRDSADLSRGFGMLTGAQRRRVLSRMVDLSQQVFVGGNFDSLPMSVDTIMLAVNLFSIYIGTMSTESFHSMPQEEIELLPGVCLLAAFKFDEDNVLPKLVQVLVADDEESWKRVKKQAAKLEWKVLHQTDFRLKTPTPVTFIHLYLERAVLDGALARQDTLAVRAKAADIAWGWVRDGFGVEYFPSELGATALYCTALCEYGASTAANVAAVAGCPLYCPRFLRLCVEVESSPGGPTDSVRAWASTGSDSERSQKENLSTRLGIVWAGESDTDDNTPLPSADVQGHHEAFFQEGQAGLNENYTPLQRSAKLKPPPDPGTEDNADIITAAAAREVGRGGQVVASYPIPQNDDWSWEDGADFRVTPPPAAETRQPTTPDAEHMRHQPPLTDDYDPTEPLTLPTVAVVVAGESMNVLADTTAYPSPPRTVAGLRAVQSRHRPGTCSRNRGRSRGRQAPIRSLSSDNNSSVRGGAAFESVFFPTIHLSPRHCTDDGDDAGASRSDASTGRLVEVGAHFLHGQSPLALSRRPPEANVMVGLYGVDGISGMDSSVTRAPLVGGAAVEEQRYSIPAAVSAASRPASEERPRRADHPWNDGQQVQHAALDGGWGPGGGRSRDGVIFEGDELLASGPLAMQPSSRDRLLAPADVWNESKDDWLRVATRDLEAAREALGQVEPEMVAEMELNVDPLSWTLGGVLIPRCPQGGERRREGR